MFEMFNRIVKWIIRVLAFFSKEMNEVRRQPRLVLSLILGPTLVLLMFGIGYQRDRPVLRTGLVIPASIEPDLARQLYNLASLNFKIEAISEDREEMMRRLEAGEFEVIQIFPSDLRGRVLSGQQPRVEFMANTINPIDEQWIQYLAYTEVSEINRAILIEAAREIQNESSATLAEIEEASRTLANLQEGLSSIDRERAIQVLRNLRESAGLISISSPLLLRNLPSDIDADEVQRTLRAFREDVANIETALIDDDIGLSQERLEMARDRLEELQRTALLLRSVSPEQIVSPLRENYANVRGQAVLLMVYYAPGVVALMIQHIAVTLGALAIVRERMLGSIEMFQVAPISSRQVIYGKYLAYVFFILLISAALTAALVLLGVPMPSDLRLYVAMIILLTLASLGLGFLLSVFSQSDSQAIQLSMLILLLSIFFSGFLLPLESFLPFISVVGAFLPLTHGISGLRALTLEGTNPEPFTWAALLVLSAVSFLVVAAGMRKLFQQV
jgi:ABC-2 type transport system permease protein